MTPDAFIASLIHPAQDSQKITKIPASFVIAEGALESGWGTSRLATEAFNLFGVKANASWHGDVLLMPTKEFLQGTWVTQEAKWRKYDGWLSCIQDHATFLLNNPRYAPAFKTTNVNDFVHEIAASGYATDPAYGQKIMSIIHQHNLIQYDQ